MNEMKAQSTAAERAMSSTESRSTMCMDEHAAWPVLSRLPLPLSAEVQLALFKVRDLLALKQGQVIDTCWRESDDVKLRAGDVQVGWAEFEVEEQKLLVRLTRLA
jgi:flagellar motor switch protein FliM